MFRYICWAFVLLKEGGTTNCPTRRRRHLDVLSFRRFCSASSSSSVFSDDPFVPVFVVLVSSSIASDDDPKSMMMMMMMVVPTSGVVLTTRGRFEFVFFFVRGRRDDAIGSRKLILSSLLSDKGPSPSLTRFL